MDSQPKQEHFRRWLLAAGIFFALIFFFSPSFAVFRIVARAPEMSGLIETRRGMSVLEQVAHPGAPTADELHRAIQWRLLFPVIGHVLNLPASVIFALAPIGCVVVLAYLASLLRRRGIDWGKTALALVILGAASWFFTATGWLGYFDSWLGLGLLLVAFAKNRRTVWIACLLTPWVDERFVIAAPLALICRAFCPPESGGENKSAVAPWREAVAPALLLGIFLVVRLVVLPARSAEGATVGGYFGGRNFLDAPFSRIALGVWEGLRAAWLFIVAAVILLRPRPLRAAIVAGATAIVAIAGLATAQDYSRSMTMLLPVAVLGLLLAIEQKEVRLAPALRGGAVAALLLPAHHVMNDHVRPIFYLYHELAVLDDPPRLARPELYELRAIHEMERGEYAAAHKDLTLAIKLAENPASPARQRGILAASQGRWQEALGDFSLAVKHDAENPDAWLMQAQAHLALRDAAAARTDMERARSLAPSDWTTRPDVARFLARLNSSP